ncbi:MAG: electron transfer flavoprotein subunit alpha/FixB family protein [Verrucomicrobiia bacterium]
MSTGIMVLVEHLKGVVSEITFEMLGAARKIAEANKAPVFALIVGRQATGMVEQMGAADAVLVAEDNSSGEPSPELVLAALRQVVESKQIGLVLIGGTNVSFGLGGRLAARVGLPFVNFCKDVRVEDGALVCTSQLFGGKMLCDVRLADGRGVLGIYPGSFPAEAGRSAKSSPVELVPVPGGESKVVFKRLVEPESGDVDITKQDVLVSVGRGIQTADNIALAEELAGALGGAVSASRPIVDQGWLPMTRQVGKSGMSVKPKLYLALGISGAPEHWEGMKDSSLIIAVNTDPKAPIFDFAHYGTTIDCLELIEPLKEAISRKKSA